MSAQRKSKKIHLTTAQAMVKYLQVQYSEMDGERRRLIVGIFGIFGHGNVTGLGQALEECGKELPYFQGRNEQGMVHVASGFAKASKRLSTFACTSSIGPGATNMIIGAATATINRLPVLLIPSDYFGTRHQGSVLQQLEHPISADVSVNDCFRPVSRFFDRILRPEHLLTALPNAMRVLTDPVHTGTVTIAFPQDVQSHAYDYPAHFFEKRIWRIERTLPQPQRIAEATQMIKKAKRPMIIAGGGVHYSDASGELQKFVETFGIPVAETFGGKSCIRNATPMLLGGNGVEGTSASVEIAAKADLVLCIGTRMGDFATGSQTMFHHPEVKFIGINPAGFDAFKQGALPIIADARETLNALQKSCRSAGVKPRSAYAKDIRNAISKWEKITAKESTRTFPKEAMSQGHLIKTLNDEAKNGDTVVAAAGAPPGDLLKLWDATGGRRCLLEFGNSCMGWELPAGLGIRMTQPKGEVYVFIGDGTYLMNPTDIVTAIQEDLKITVVVSDNHGFQIIRRLQMWRSGVSFGNEFRKRESKKAGRLEGDYLEIDIAENAKSMGARGWHVSNEKDLRQALREARKEKCSCVIVVEIEKHRYAAGGGAWWDAAPAEVSKSAVTKKIRAEYESDRKKWQRFHY